jgi:phosphoglycerol transferase MdoB-like AlkP superfamily enzyme
VNLSATFNPLIEQVNLLAWINETPHASDRATPLKAAFLNRKTPVFLFAFLYLILPNLPLLLSTRALGATPHGYINLEYLLIGAVGVFLPRGVVFLLLCLDSLADVAYTICYTFQFSLKDMLSSIRYLSVLPSSRVLEGLALLVLVLVVCALLAVVRPRPQKHLWTAVVLLSLVALLVPVDLISGQNPLGHKDLAILSYRIARSPAFTLLWREKKDVRANHASPNGSGEEVVPSASSEAVLLLESRPGAAAGPNVVLVLIESWGLMSDPHLAQALAAPYGDSRIASKYKVMSGTVAFTGLTVPGEARELCHSSVGFGIIDDTAEQAKPCLPAFFHEHGYQDIAIHGYVGEMFNRYAWYRKLGFDRTVFEPDLKKSGLPNCRGAFPGVCDTSIAHWIGSSLLSEDQPKPRFIYWVTLNSHIPVPEHPDLPDDGVCASQPALHQSAPLCTWFRLVRAVHQSVQETALGATARPTVFILVGDHAPPFSNPQLREQFSNTQVPYVMLIPKEIPAR